MVLATAKPSVAEAKSRASWPRKDSLRSVTGLQGMSHVLFNLGAYHNDQYYPGARKL